MRAVVTGSAGFIGSNLVGELIARGYRVVGVDRHPRRATASYRHLVVDLAESPCGPEVATEVAAADVVFHLAARPGVRGGGSAIEWERRRDNVVATRNLLSVVPLETPVVATSSSSVYGNRSGPAASHEEDELHPRGGYARSKVAMEQMCARRRSQGGRVAVVRPFTVAGEGQRADMAFSLWLAALRRGEPIRLLGSKDRSRDITDVRDVVEGLIRAGERELNTTLNLGTGVGHRLFDMARALIEASGLDGEVVHSAVPLEEVVSTLADTTRCESLLGFVPITDLPALLARQVQASPTISELVPA